MLPTALCGTWRKHRQGNLDHRSLLQLAPGIVLGAAAGALFALQLHGPALALAFVAQSAYRLGPAARGARRAEQLACTHRPAQRGLPASWCMAPLAGAFCACLGMGGGSLVVPYLVARGVALLPATAVSQGVNLCIALGGALGFAVLPAAPGALGTTVCWPAALLIGASATLAVPFGVAAAPRTPLRLFQRALGIVNLLAAAVLLLRTLWP